MTDTAVFDPRHALIIGAGPGLGAALARRFAREGFTLTLLGRKQESLDALRNDLQVDGAGTVNTAIADAADPIAFKAALDALATSIAPGVVVYNAAVVASDNVLTSDLQYLIDAYSIDAVGAISAAQVFTPAMRAANTGTYLVSGGYAWVDPNEAHASLALGKAGVRTVVALLHDELKADGVHATSTRISGAITPGTSLDPDLIADEYWDLHNQSVDRWTDEIVIVAE